MAVLTAIIPGCGNDPTKIVYDNPLDPVSGEHIPIPDSVRITVGDRSVRLDWRLSGEGTARDYAIFRSSPDSETERDEILLDRSNTTSFEDTRVRNGQIYLYRIAAGVGGQFGPRTEPVEAQPGLFIVQLSNDDRTTRTTAIEMSFRVANAEAVSVSESPDSPDPIWRPAVSPLRVELSSGDGTKTVYARFRFTDGSESRPVSDSIVLDTGASISTVDFDGAPVRAPGDRVHFRVVTGESGGEAAISVDQVFDAVPLHDDGSHGDRVAEDGTYEGDLIIPSAPAAESKAVRAEFTDGAGNTAVPVSAARQISIHEAPQPVIADGPELTEPPEAAAATVRWSRSLEPAFAAYRIYRSGGASVDSSDVLVGSVTSESTTEFQDAKVVEGRSYSYRVYVENTSGMLIGSNTVRTTVPNVRPPEVVTLQTPEAVSTSAIVVEWSRSTDLDAASYRLYRNEVGAVGEGDPVVAEIPDINHPYWEDTGLRENTTYYYRVSIVDGGGLATRSNEVSARTKNIAPPAVVLNEAGQIDSTSATLSWAASTVHDFALYRLFRDEVPTVTTASHQVVEVDEQSSTVVRDVNLTRGARYYYRLFVVDNGDDSKSTGSNTISIVTR
jgi:hypothetical protein